MSGRNKVDTQQKVKNFFGQTAKFNANQQIYLTGNQDHQMVTLSSQDLAGWTKDRGLIHS